MGHFRTPKDLGFFRSFGPDLRRFGVGRLCQEGRCRSCERGWGGRGREFLHAGYGAQSAHGFFEITLLRRGHDDVRDAHARFLRFEVLVEHLIGVAGGSGERFSDGRSRETARGGGGSQRRGRRSDERVRTFKPRRRPQELEDAQSDEESKDQPEQAAC